MSQKDNEKVVKEKRFSKYTDSVCTYPVIWGEQQLEVRGHTVRTELQLDSFRQTHRINTSSPPRHNKVSLSSADLGEGIHGFVSFCLDCLKLSFLSFRHHKQVYTVCTIWVKTYYPTFLSIQFTFQKNCNKTNGIQWSISISSIILVTLKNSFKKL